MRAALVAAIETRDALGEGAAWRASDQSVWWTDIEGRRLHRLGWPSRALTTWSTPGQLTAFGFQAGTDELICAFAGGFARWRPGEDAPRWIATEEALGDGMGAGMRLNDGRVSPAGELWAASMHEAPLPAGEAARGTLYRLRRDGRVRALRRGATISNGLCWSPDGRTAYHADSATGALVRAGVPAEPEDAPRWRPYGTVADGSPDGAVTDAEGRVWTAVWGAGRVACVGPDGAEVASIGVPARQVTCPVFGGPALRHLFVTSAWIGLSDEALAAEPQAGALFVFETDVQGTEGPLASYPVPR